MSKKSESAYKNNLKQNSNKNNNIIEFSQKDDLLKKVNSIHLPRWEELPDIDLYLDQLVTLIEKNLNPYVYDMENPIITKTMINNYVKHGIIDPPEKKKYNRAHISSIFVICILKSVYSMNNVSKLLKLATTNFKIEYSYNKFCELFEQSMKSIFSHKKIEFDKNASDDLILLQNVIQSVAYKIYVEKTFLENINKEE